MSQGVPYGWSPNTLPISSDVRSGIVRSGCVMKMPSNSGCSRSPNRNAVNIASCICSEVCPKMRIPAM
jgi:hypothetical protein